MKAIAVGLNGLFKSFLTFETHFWLQKVRGFPSIRRRFKSRLGYELDLKNPQSFNQKIVHRMLFDRDERYPIIVDKYRVRDYVAKKLGSEFLIPLIDAVDNPEDLNFDAYPESFVIKTNFSSGQNILVPKKASLNRVETVNTLKQWMSKPYGFEKLNWPPQHIPRKIVVEKMLFNEQGEIPNDYKFLCFNGVPKLIQVDIDRFGEHKRSMYTENWELTPIKYDARKLSFFSVEVDRPVLLDHMLEIATTLSKDFSFMRVDLYEIAGKIYFGEMTPTPGSGTLAFEPLEFDFKYGELIPAISSTSTV